MSKTSPATVCAHALISGRVQGIFFRASARSEALNRNLVGWVRNTPEGKVEITAQGRKEDVEDFLDWCRSGPMLAEVSEAKIEWAKPADDLKGFEIKEYIAGVGHAVRALLRSTQNI